MSTVNPMPSLNARMSASDPRLYNVSRDVAHNFGDAIKEVAGRIEDERWDCLVDLAKTHLVTGAELGLACAALCKFIATQDEQKETMEEGMVRCGWFECNPLAQAIVMAYLGTVMLGYHWAGVRETTIKGVGPAMHYKELRSYGRRCAEAMCLPRWKRNLLDLRRRLRKAWCALWDLDLYED